MMVLPIGVWWLGYKITIVVRTVAVVAVVPVAMATMEVVAFVVVVAEVEVMVGNNGGGKDGGDVGKWWPSLYSPRDRMCI